MVWVCHECTIYWKSGLWWGGDRVTTRSPESCPWKQSASLLWDTTSSFMRLNGSPLRLPVLPSQLFFLRCSAHYIPSTAIMSQEQNRSRQHALELPKRVNIKPLFFTNYPGSGILIEQREMESRKSQPWLCKYCEIKNKFKIKTTSCPEILDGNTWPKV